MTSVSTMDVLKARRIVIQGVTGAGKSTAARTWAVMKNLHVIDYDNDVLWMPALELPWTTYSTEKQREWVAAIWKLGRGSCRRAAPKSPILCTPKPMSLCIWITHRW